MTPVQTLLAATQHGASLSVGADGKLHVRGGGSLPSDVKAALLEHGPRLIELLSLDPSMPPRCRPCGRPQHEPDLVCGPDRCLTWQDPDPTYPIAPAFVPLEP